MTYVRAEKAQIDSWEAIGNTGWNWESLLPYYKKSERFDAPTAAQIAAGASYDPADHGVDGPLSVGYPFQLLNGSLREQVEQAWGSLGMLPNPDANGGSVRGFTVWQSTLDREANVREDAARAYYYPIQDRPNLHVFLNTTVNRILWEDGDETVANGVEITSSNGTISTLGARKEVIVSAGSLRTPTILELSGIGNPL
jgi:choline dehydrogenase-like flavoprotein